jgi:hypothetical protein
MPQDPVQRLVSNRNPASSSDSPRWIRRRTPSWAGRISLHPDGKRLAVSFVLQHGKIYMLEGFDESTSWFDRLMRRF